MTKALPALTEDPPKEDSEDLTDSEIERAVFTRSLQELTQRLTEEIQQNRDFSLKRHELRRRGGHLFWRTTLVANREPDKVLVFSVDWLQGDTTDGLQQQRFLDIPE